MQHKLQQLSQRLEEIDTLLAREETARDLNRLRALGQERAEIEPVVTRFHEYRRAQADHLGAQEMMSDADMKALAEEEVHSARARMDDIEAELQRLLLPKDLNDERNIFVEVRAEV